MTDIVSYWREFEQTLQAKGLGWALEYAPADLRTARMHRHPYGARLDRLLPADYLAFVKEVGYPVLGFEYYDRQGMSFLPPEPMAVLSPMVHDHDHGFPEETEGEPTMCRHAFFAGYDLSDIHGFALTEDGVWVVEDSSVVEHAGTFTQWLQDELKRLEQEIAEPGFADCTEPDEAADPHRLFGYSLESNFTDRSPYSAADLELSWVEEQVGSPYSYGLIDASGRWRIPMGRRYVEVRPFRDGVAEVRLPAEDGSYGGPWVRIDTEGETVGQ
ncbi:MULTISPECIES: WG repeat-containing protein [Streptomyces]|uniref:WG repeat-containing protein n=1 Tax=Streptomyces TaxID=1883 RepID=UPI0004C4A41D|nr:MULTISPECIES: WG repeat-containing protein [Streptomyces]RPK89333.1 hypothetical protein EES46_15705 [Streptomyces sp. ADI98-10]